MKKHLFRIHHEHFGSVIIALITLLFVCSFMDRHPLLILLFILGLFGVFGTLIGTIWNKRSPRFISLAVAFIAVISGAMALLPGVLEGHTRTLLAVCSICYAIFIGISMASIGKAIFDFEKVSVNTIMGSICIYLLIGMFFAFLSAAVALIIPHSYYLEPTPSGIAISHVGDFMVYSYSMLTTTGFNFVIPKTDFARTLGTFESVIGNLYIAIMIARLVGMHVSQRAGEKR